MEQQKVAKQASACMRFGSQSWRWKQIPEIFRDELVGKYSIERFRALQEYQQTTSKWRVLLVLLLTPLPSAILMIASNYVPMQDPTKGLRANWAFFVRALLFFGVVDFTNQRQVAFVTKKPIGVITGLGTALVGGLVMTIALLAISLLSGTFPVPFGYLLVYAPITFLFAICITRNSHPRHQPGYCHRHSSRVCAENDKPKPATRLGGSTTTTTTTTTNNNTMHETKIFINTLNGVNRDTVRKGSKTKYNQGNSPHAKLKAVGSDDSGGSDRDMFPSELVSSCSPSSNKNRSFRLSKSDSNFSNFCGDGKRSTTATMDDSIMSDQSRRTSSAMTTITTSIKDKSSMAEDLSTNYPCVSRDQLRARTNAFLRVLSVQNSFIFVFTAFTIGYKQLDTQRISWQVGYVCLLPVLKKFLTSVDRSRLATLEDIAPETIAFSVKFFSSLYLSICLGISRTWMISALSIALDVAHLLVSFHHVHFKCSLFLKQVEPVSWKEREKFVWSCLDIASKNLRIIQSTEADIRTEASNGLQFRRPSITQVPIHLLSRRHSSSTSCADESLRHANKSVDPKPSRSTVVQHVSASRDSTGDWHSEIQLVRQTLALLYMIEYIALLEYIETFTPALYSFYVYATYSGPNHAFFYVIRDLHTSVEMQESIGTMLLYGSLELVTFVVVFGYVKWRFGINVFSVVAFVLETHWVNIQSKMVLFVTQILNLMLVHYGVDFSLHFHKERN